MYLVYEITRPLKFRFYSTYQIVRKNEQHLPTNKTHILKFKDTSLEFEILNILDTQLKKAGKEKLSTEEKADLLQKHTEFLGSPAQLEIATKALSPSAVTMHEENPHIHLYLPDRISVYTDGSWVSDGSNVGGYAAVFILHGRPFASISGHGIFNSVAEVEWKAVQESLSCITGEGHHISIYTDFINIVNFVYGGKIKWDDRILSMIGNIFAQCQKNIVTFHHIRAHMGLDGSEWNELADVLAKHEKNKLIAKLTTNPKLTTATSENISPEII